MSAMYTTVTDLKIPVTTGSLNLTSAVSVRLELDDCDDSEFSVVEILLPLPQNGKLQRTQVHKALAARFRVMLDENYLDEEFVMNGITAVSTLDPLESGIEK